MAAKQTFYGSTGDTDFEITEQFSAITDVTINAVAGQSYTLKGSKVVVAALGAAYTVVVSFSQPGDEIPLRIRTGTTGVVKASPGKLAGFDVYNTNAAVRYLHFYDKATAPTLNTDTPIYTVVLPAATRVTPGNALNIPFVNGLSWAYTTDNAAVPVTAATSTELNGSVRYT